MPRRKTLTFEQAASLYIETHSKPYLRSDSWVRAIYRRYLKRFNERRLATLDRFELQQFHGHIGVAHGKTAANHAIQVMSMIFNKMIEWNKFQGVNPCNGVRMYPKNPRKRFIEPEECKPFFEAVDVLSSAMARDFIRLALFTGSRKTKILSMRWADISFETQSWKTGLMKNGDTQRVALVPEAIEILQARAAAASPGDEFVFQTDKPSKHYKNPYKSWRRMKDKANLKEKLVIHDLRRSMGSWQAITGASLPVIGETLHHKSPQSTKIYAQMVLSPVRDAMSKAVSAMLTNA